MDFSKKETALLDRAKELIVNSFPKFHWRLDKIDLDKCKTIDESMDNALSTKDITLEGIHFLRERLKSAVGEALNDTTRFLCSKIEESVGLKEESVVEKYKERIAGLNIVNE